jgi:hypothetical protein
LQLDSLSIAAEHTLTVSDDRFEIVDSQLKLKDGLSLNFEAQASFTLEVTATSGGEVTSKEFTLSVTDVNESPGNIQLSRQEVFENIPGAWIASLTWHDPDAGDTHTVTFDDPRFTFADGHLYLKPDQSLDLAAEPAIDLQITVTDADGLSQSDAFILTVETPPVPWEYAYQWAPFPFDVDLDGSVTPLDALLVLTELNANGPYSLPEPLGGTLPPLFYDVSGDGDVNPLDALLILNYLNAHADGEAEPPADFAAAQIDPLPAAAAFAAWMVWESHYAQPDKSKSCEWTANRPQ